jgi:hypothetical protein
MEWIRMEKEVEVSEIAEQQEIKLKDLTVMNIQDGDMIIIRLPEDATSSDGQIEAIHDYVDSHLKRNDINALCFVIPFDFSVSILRGLPEEKK